MSNYFSTRFTFDYGRETVWREIAEYVRRTESTEDSVILELGAGYCFFINHVQCRKKIALDLNPEAARYAARDVKFIVGNSCNIPAVQDKSVDIVFASNFFEHLDRQSMIETFGEIRRILRQQGKLLLIQPNYKYCSRDYFDDYTHLSVFSHVSMTDFLASEGFLVERCISRFLPFSMKSRFPKKAFLVRLYLKLPFKVFAKQMYLVARKITAENHPNG
jgi:SAM-dependent methyltransferase